MTSTPRRHPTAPPGRRDLAALFGGLAAAAAAASPRGTAVAQSAWPDRPVRLVVPFGPGGAIDTLSRALAQPFPQLANGQALVVENRGGAGGTIAGGVVATSRPDGYTLMTADLGANAVGKELIPTLSYEPLRAFTPIVHLVNLPLVLIAREGLEARAIAGVVALSQRSKGGLTYATPGVGHPTHLADELLVRTAGIEATPVHYRSGSDVPRSLLQGETDFGFISLSTAMPFVREGKVRPLAVASASPVPALPQVPPATATVPGVEAATWHGIVGPAGLPADIVSAANRIFNAAVTRPEVRETIEKVQF
ncbi:MAG: tripartite tricarboxylate transporter substrate binding protein, partial [Acetobacteraceae bacterium]|nr:tripartite tricarboxylate transporter substrate binding protein [Acetobacteraceae bacterium]